VSFGAGPADIAPDTWPVSGWAPQDVAPPAAGPRRKPRMAPRP